jgi:phospholipase/lecithinase/hemolysin
MIHKIRIGFALAVSSLLLLNSCGGGGGGGSGSGGTPPTGSSPPPPPGGVTLQVVSFGDSLSDVGTFAPIANAVGGGRFTTNPGQVWTQDVGDYYGSQVAPAFTIGLTYALSPQGGLGYAEGGATVATPQSGFLESIIGDVEMPVDQQIASYLQTYKSFNSSQLVLVWAGANDVLRAGDSPTSAPTVELAANTFATLIAQMVQAGAVHVVVVDVPNVGASPKGITSADGGVNLTQLSQLFNTTLVAALQAKGLTDKIIYVDSYTWMNGILANYHANGFLVSNTGQACSDQRTPDDTALFCSPPTYVDPAAAETYIFADDLHFATHMHALFAQYVEQQIAATGLGH